MSDQNVKLDQILEGINNAKGGVRMLLLLGSIAASVGAGIHWLLQHVGSPPP